MVEKNRLLSLLKLWHPSKKSSTGDAVEGSSHSQHKTHPCKQPVRQDGRRGWIPHWNLLHIDRRSCAQTKDVCMEGPYQNHDHGFLPALPKEHKTDNAAQRKLRTSFIDLHEKLNESSNSKVTERCTTEGHTEPSKGGTTVDVNVVGVDLQQHKSCLKNRVLPVTVQEDVHFSTTFKLRTTTLCTVDEEGPGSMATITAESETPKRIGSRSFKRINFARISSTPVSPRSPSENKWRMLLSCSSQAGSPRSPRCFHQAAEWNSSYGEMSHQKGSVSTMGSPWHSQAGGHRLHNQRSFFKGSYKQGQWITTDSDFVVLEL